MPEDKDSNDAQTDEGSSGSSGADSDQQQSYQTGPSKKSAGQDERQRGYKTRKIQEDRVDD
jgi:hypothetical protein